MGGRPQNVDEGNIENLKLYREVDFFNKTQECQL